MAALSLVLNKARSTPLPWLSAICLWLAYPTATTLAADASQPVLWSCVSVDDGGEWQCSGNEEPQQPAELSKQESAEPPPADAVGNTPTVSEETAQESARQTLEAPLREMPRRPLAPAEALTLEPTALPPRDGDDSSSTEFSTFSRTASAHECQADGDQWNCQTNPTQISAQPSNKGYVESYPDAYAKAPEDKRKESPGDELKPRSQSQWDCQPGAEDQGWNCQEIARKTPAAPEQLQTASAYPYAHLDWYEFSDGADYGSHCSGRYIEPEQLFADADLNVDEQPTYINANKTRTQGGSLTTLEGNVYLRKGNSQIRSQVAQLDHDNERAELQGSVLFREPGSLILADTAVFDQARGQTTLDNSQFVFQQSHMRGSATRITRYDSGDTYITNGQYTRCEPGNDSWTLNGDEIILYKNDGVGIAKHATLEIAGVPVFYLPLIHFPIDDRRKSGFLTPGIAYSEDNGLDVTAPYYLNLAANYDATITPRYLEKRGLMFENEFRYLDQAGNLDFSLALLAGDDVRNDEDRWLFGINHKGTPADRWSSSINYTAVSDNDYFDELDTSLNISQETHLDQTASLGYSGNNWRFNSKIQSYQTISDTATKPYQKLPQLTLSGEENFSDDEVAFSYLADYSNFDRDSSDFTGNAATTGGRAHLETSLGTEYYWPWAYVRPKLRLTHTSYQLSNQPSGNDENPSRTLPLLSVDSGLYLDRESEFGGKPYTHTLEPRVYYLYVPDEDQSGLPDFDSSELTFSYSQLFRDNRFSGLDRIGDTHQITLGLTTRFLEDNGQELFHASIGQIYYLEDREVRLSDSDPILTDSASDFAAEAVWRVSQDLRFTADGEWDQDDFSNNKRNLKLAYRSDVDHQFNVGYRFTRDSLEQTDISFMWPVNPRWSVLGRWLQDIENSESLDKILGVEYENCCWRVRTVYRSWIDDDASDRENTGVFLQFTLKGLGTFGTRAAGDSGPKAKNFLEDISGFEERESNE